MDKFEQVVCCDLPSPKGLEMRDRKKVKSEVGHFSCS